MTNNIFSSTTKKKKGPVSIAQALLKKQSKSKGRFNVSQNFFDEKKEMDADLAKDIEEAKVLKTEHDKRVKRETSITKEKLVDMAFIIGCVYFLFLTFGVWSTTYVYDNTGKIVAQQMTYGDIAKKESFDVLLQQYLKCRDLYEKALEIDKKIATGEKALALAPQYELLVTEAENLYLKTDALSIDAQYEQVRTMLLTWLKEDLATYCKNMSIAISQNNNTVAQTAMKNRKSVYNDFSLITENIVVMGDLLTGVDLTEVKKWDKANIYN